MCNSKCKFCSKYVDKLNNDGRCNRCDKEYKEIIAAVISRRGIAINKQEAG